MSKKIDFAQIAMKTAGLGAGSIGAAVIQAKFLTNVGRKISPFILIAGGAMLPVLMPKVKILEHVGDGMIARGMSDAASVFMPGLVPDASVTGIYGSDAPATVYGIGESVMDLQLEDNPTVSMNGIGLTELVDSKVKMY